MNLQLAWRNIFRNKRRTLISVASILFAVFFACLMRSLQKGVYENMIENAVGFYTGFAQVQHPDYWQDKVLENSVEENSPALQELQNHPEIKNLVPRISSFALASFEERTKGILVTGVDPTLEEDVIGLSSKLDQGSYFKSGSRSLIISSGLAKYLDLAVADTLVMLGMGYQGATAAGKYSVDGIVSFGSPELNSNMVFMPIKLAQEFYACPGLVSNYIIDLKDPNKLDQTLASLNPEGLAVLSWREILPELIQLIEADSAAGMVMLGILYLIIGFGMFGTILMMTNERVYEFGILVSIGMKKWKLILVFLLESIFLSLLGVLAGIILSIPVLTYFYFNPIRLASDFKDLTEKFDIEPVLNFSLDPSIFLSQAIFVLGMALIINVYPIWKIWQLNPIKAMRT